MKRNRLIIFLVLVAIEIGAKLANVYMAKSLMPAHTYSKVVDDESFKKLANDYSNTPNDSIILPPEPYQLTPEQKTDAEKCVEKELSSDPSSEKENVEKYCKCLSTFDDKKF